jgi:hypothetical protein
MPTEPMTVEQAIRKVELAARIEEVTGFLTALEAVPDYHVQLQMAVEDHLKELERQLKELKDAG